DRRPYRLQAVDGGIREELAACLGGEFEVAWVESAAMRWKLARIQSRATDIRLRIPEAHSVHQEILDWDRDSSPDRVPAGAVGVDPVTAGLMHWALADWRRVRRLNRWAAGTLVPRLEMDLLPALFSGAHLLVFRRAAPGSVEEETEQLFRLGAGLQRLWLTATRRGLAMQPNLAPLCFAHYGRHGIPFTEDAGALGRAERLTEHLAGLIPGRDQGALLFLGRVGWPRKRVQGARSVRRSWTELVRGKEPVEEPGP
ncbi:MAG TPA: molybdopterin biosynthesis protein MoeY, partial [Gammaproteobacteria bacterium]|nr:molybdopterin biosynthesis protein MoeY [Gammaproteobacteria bacterium]